MGVPTSANGFFPNLMNKTSTAAEPIVVGLGELTASLTSRAGEPVQGVGSEAAAHHAPPA